jgi:hypothetical protein
MGAPAPDGLERAGVYSGMGILVVEAMTWQGPGMEAPRPAYCSTAAGSSWAHLGPPGPVGFRVLWLLCLANDCLSAVEVVPPAWLRAAVPGPDNVVSLRWSGRRPVS